MWRAQARQGEKKRETGMYVAIHEDFELLFYEASPSAVVVRIPLGGNWFFGEFQLHFAVCVDINGHLAAAG